MAERPFDQLSVKLVGSLGCDFGAQSSSAVSKAIMEELADHGHNGQAAV